VSPEAPVNVRENRCPSLLRPSVNSILEASSTSALSGAARCGFVDGDPATGLAAGRCASISIRR
jgi:hypothetical protein